MPSIQFELKLLTASAIKIAELIKNDVESHDFYVFMIGFMPGLPFLGLLKKLV